MKELEDLFDGEQQQNASVQKNTTEIPPIIYPPEITPEGIARHLNSGGKVYFVAQDSKAIIVKQEFDPEFAKKIIETTEQLSKIGAVQSQSDVENANVVLKRAKQLIKTLSEQRKLMTSVLDEEKSRLMRYEEDIIGSLQNLVNTINTNINFFQNAELEKRRKKEAEEKAIRDAEVEKARQEQQRKEKIQAHIIEWENSVLKAAQSATLDDIDAKIEQLNNTKIKSDVFMEFVSEAEVMYERCKVIFQQRKVELVQLKNASDAERERLRVEQEANAKAQAEILQNKAEILSATNAEEVASAAANAQMEYELKVSRTEKQKNVSTKWVFEEDTIDMALLPEEYKTFDAEKIKQAVKDGVRQIPGVVIKETVINVAR